MKSEYEHYSEVVAVAKELYSLLASLDHWRRLLASLVAVHAWSSKAESELMYVMMQVRSPKTLKSMAKCGALRRILSGRVRNLPMALTAFLDAIEIAPELEELVDVARERPVIVREFLRREIRGLGRKGSSMFLRDSGVRGVYPLDRHVLRWTFGAYLSKSDLNKIWGSARRYRSAELKFEERARREFPDLDPALANVVVYLLGALGSSTRGVLSYMETIAKWL